MDETTPILHQRPIDQLVANLCQQLAAQREQIAALETLAISRGDDAESYRLVANQAIEALHREQQAHERLRILYKNLITENRELRGRAPDRKAA